MEKVAAEPKGHGEMEGNEKPDELARFGASKIPRELTPFRGVPLQIVKNNLNQWLTGASQQHRECRYAKEFFFRYSKMLTSQVLNLDRKKICLITALLSGQQTKSASGQTTDCSRRLVQTVQ